MNPSPSAQNPISQPLKKANPSSHFTPLRPSYNLAETQTCNNIFLLFCREILESVWEEEENFEVLARTISKYI